MFLTHHLIGGPIVDIAEECYGYHSTEKGVLKDVSITIDSGKIGKIGHDLGDLRLNDYDKVIDGRGKVVIPGLVNAHTHAAMVLFPGYDDDLPLSRWLEERIWPAERKLTAEDVYWA
ncbi:hypothetical protein KAV67_00845, partial [Candidatus Bipolaricaulota bacterium]|nr:hypothetical protein [Candidatus Bipolaricaulota bacterium]